jgi:hypothetical protein
MKILKPLAIAALSLAMLAPATAQLSDLPAFRVITAYTYYRQVLTCESAYIRRAEELTKAIVDKAKAEEPSLNLERLWREAWRDLTGVPLQYSVGPWCQGTVNQLEALLSGIPLQKEPPKKRPIEWSDLVSVVWRLHADPHSDNGPKELQPVADCLNQQGLTSDDVAAMNNTSKHNALVMNCISKR